MTYPKWYLDADELLARLIDAGSTGELARITGVPPRTLRRHVARLRNRGVADDQAVSTPTPESRVAEPAELLAAGRRVDRLNAEVRSLRAQLRVAGRHADLLDDVRDLLAPVIAGCVLPRPRKVTPPKPRRQAVSIVLHLCDLHWGENVHPDHVGGLNAYNPEIAASRLQHAVDTTLAWVANYTELAGVDEIVLAVNGDTASGQHSLHPDSADEYARIAVQVLDAALVIAQVAYELALAVPRVRIVGTQGNHTRSTRRMPTGPARISTSWETLLHEFTAALLGQVPNVSTIIARGYRVQTQIGPSTWAFMHGDAMKGGGGALGIPAYGLKRAHDSAREQSLTLAQMQAGVGLDGVVRHSRYGHFHMWTKWQIGDGDTAITPSPKGVDSFVADVLAKYSPAALSLEVVHPEHDVIADHVIRLQHIMEPAPTRYVWGALTDDKPATDRMKAWISDRVA